MDTGRLFAFKSGQLDGSLPEGALVCVCTHLSGVHVLHGCCKAHHMSQQNRKTVHARVRNKQAERLG